MKYIFITGMFRSGTTLFAKSLNTHPDITIASDPLKEFFKSFRNEIFIKNKDKLIDEKEPFTDNFYNEHQKSKKDISEGNFNIKMENQNIKIIKENIIKAGEIESSLLMTKIKEINEDNYMKFYKKTMEKIKETYGNKETNLIGIKEVWCEEFISTLINTFPNMKCIQIMRDPRAIIASKKAGSYMMYPYLFLIRQWRKSCAYALINSKKSKNHLLVKYEDFVKNPEKTSKKMCVFLNLKYDKNMILGEKFKDGKGNSWIQNTSYENPSKNITKDSLNKWEIILSKKEIQYIEDLCEFEMKLFNYKRTTPKNHINTYLNPLKDNEKNINKWILPYFDLFKSNEENILKDVLRWYIIKNNKTINFNKEFIEKIFIDKDFFKNSKSYNGKFN